MLSIWHPAPAALTGVLKGIWSVRSAPDAQLAARVLPDGTTCLAFQGDGTVLRSCDDESPWAASCVSGPRTGPFEIELNAAGRLLIVQLHPAAAMRALGVPMSLLADRFEPLDAVMGAASHDISEHVLSGGDDNACVRAIERWLLQRVRAEPLNFELTDAVVDEVARRGGRVRVNDLATHVDLSRRHLTRIMQQRVGVSPKLFARITRFDQAVQMGRFRSNVSWARIALDAGYADQAHLTREFVELGGIRPSDLRGPAAARIW